MSWAFGQVPVVCALAGFGSITASQDNHNTRALHATNADTAPETTVRSNTGSSLVKLRHPNAALDQALPATSRRVGPAGVLRGSGLYTARGHAGSPHRTCAAFTLPGCALRELSYVH
jgi:hypothetical protein